MIRPWSISTSIRNPYRNIDFLNILSEYEGELLNEKNMSLFFKNLIKYKCYIPQNLSTEFKELYKNSVVPFTDSQVELILSFTDYKFNKSNTSPDSIYAGRGISAIKNLKDFGFIIAEKNSPIIITSAGKEVLYDNNSFKYVLKDILINWEKTEDNYSVKPFLDTLFILYYVNSFTVKLGIGNTGLSQYETGVFISTLINSSYIKKHVGKIIKLRRELSSAPLKEHKQIKEIHFKNHLVEFYQSTNNSFISKKLRNSNDYGDTIMKYFACTNILYINDDKKLDILPFKNEEVSIIIKKHFKGFNNEI